MALQKLNKLEPLPHATYSPCPSLTDYHQFCTTNQQLKLILKNSLVPDLKNFICRIDLSIVDNNAYNLMVLMFIVKFCDLKDTNIF